MFFISCYPTAGGEPDAVKVNLKPAARLRKTEEVILFRNLTVRARSAGGNIVTKAPVRNVVRMSKAAREQADQT